MKKGAKTKQIAVRFDDHSYDKICCRAEEEHRGLGEFIRHAALFYIKHFEGERELPKRKDGARP